MEEAKGSARGGGRDIDVKIEANRGMEGGGARRGSDGVKLDDTEKEGKNEEEETGGGIKNGGG